VTVFQFSLFFAIYKRSSEFWKKVNFSELESHWVSRLVARCRVTLQAWRTLKAVRSLKIDVLAGLWKPAHRRMASAFRMRPQQSSGWYWDEMWAYVCRWVIVSSLRVQWLILWNLIYSRSRVSDCLWAWFRSSLAKIMACDIKINFLISKVILW